MWRLTSGRGASRKTEAVRINGTLTTNDGEIAVKWALEGHGILMRAEWDIKQYLDAGELVRVLPDHDTPNADIFAVYSQRHQMSNRIRAFVDFIALELQSAAGEFTAGRVVSSDERDLSRCRYVVDYAPTSVRRTGSSIQSNARLTMPWHSHDGASRAIEHFDTTATVMNQACIMGLPGPLPSRPRDARPACRTSSGRAQRQKDRPVRSPRRQMIRMRKFASTCHLANG